jgi:hypothetical protein
MKSVPTCTSLCEEFTDTVLIDSKHNSIIVNVAEEWFDVLNQRLLSIGFKLIHKSKIGESYTCAFIPRI